MTRDRRARWRLRFSLRTLFIGVTVFIVWFGYNLEVAKRQQAACQEIRQLGGYQSGWISYERNWDMSTPGIPARRTSWKLTNWVRSIVGEDFMQPVAFVAAPGAKDDLSFLESLPHLKALTLETSGIGDDSVKQLSHLHDLRYLWLEGTDVSDDALNHLSGLSELRELYLKNTNVTDTGITTLKQYLPDCNVHSGDF